MSETFDVPGEGDLFATLHTTMGDITFRLFEQQAPKTVANFVGLATGGKTWTGTDGTPQNKPFYDGTIIHRVVPEFRIHLGCPIGNGRGGPGFTIEEEIHPELRHDRGGVVSMWNDGEENNGGSQFFITEVACRWLDQKHTVFGGVTKGLEVIKKCARVHRDHNDKPWDAITVERVEVFRG